MKKGMVEVLAYLAGIGASKGFADVSTAGLASALGISQQSASRWLSSLEKEGVVERKRAGVRLTEKGVGELASFQKMLSSSLEAGPLKLKGKVFTGLSDGRFYMTLEGYRKQFAEKLGFVPFPGTLNLKLEEPGGKKLLKEKKSVEIQGFKFEWRVFGGLTAYPAKIRGITCFVVVPERSHYGDDVVEIVSKDFLRQALGLKDGDEAEVEV